MPFVLNDVTQSSPEIHVGDEGTNFIITVYNQDETVVDLSDATGLNLIFMNPERTVTEHTATLYTNGKDGKALYVLNTGDIDIEGRWSYQLELTFPTGAWRTNIINFVVYPNLPEVPVIP